ncbi:MAG: hypothetical protein ACT4PT_12905 [Methanobacteriota archaeon]
MRRHSARPAPFLLSVLAVLAVVAGCLEGPDAPTTPAPVETPPPPRATPVPLAMESCVFASGAFVVPQGNARPFVPERYAFADGSGLFGAPLPGQAVVAVEALRCDTLQAGTRLLEGVPHAHVWALVDRPEGATEVADNYFYSIAWTTPEGPLGNFLRSYGWTVEAGPVEVEVTPLPGAVGRLRIVDGAASGAATTDGSIQGAEPLSASFAEYTDTPNGTIVWYGVLDVEVGTGPASLDAAPGSLLARILGSPRASGIAIGAPSGGSVEGAVKVIHLPGPDA